MRTLLSVLGSLIAVAGTVPYIIETIRGNTKPRIVTWLTWALLTGVAGAASMSAGQLGAAVFALLGTLATSSVVVAGLRYGDRSLRDLISPASPVYCSGWCRGFPSITRSSRYGQPY
jgi:hypothetical protein